MSTKKLIVIVGITGNQGGSVANAFLNLPDWRIRGISRNSSSASSAAWAAKGAEMVSGDLDDVSSLKSAFSGATAIFGITDFWQQFSIPENHALAAKEGKTINEIAYAAEVAQGHNIVDAAASVEGLDRLVLSTLSKSREWSKGKILWNYHFDSKWAAVEYLRERYPEMTKKASFVQPGMFMQNYRMMARKQEDGSYKVTSPTTAETVIPWFDPMADIGNFVRALLEVAPGKQVAGVGSWLNWNQWCELFTKISGVNCTYQQITVDDLEKAMPGGAGREIGDMFKYMEDPGYFGSDPTLIQPEDLGVEIKRTTAEDFLKVDLPSFLKA
ncbi:NAD(P)-binding protein [Lepidopterella palustris CBS 459.81]|uniref:NAD(P)-binding protein n=1 Tax=Lepidopterella palustris CBS 459.81 TaxID=1314670 RepID=A0A8E2DYS3_9PEZI|nr:NAD(P)-binding protein [Lepidopterella palustris CBS 459.81]